MRAIAIVAAILAALANAGAALAHATLTGSEPANRSVVPDAPAAVTLKFNEPVSPLTLRLVRPGGAASAVKDVEPRGNDLVVKLPSSELGNGTHFLSWRVSSADGHPVGGTLQFSIGEPSAGEQELAEAADNRLRAAIWLVRIAIYIGLFGGVGGAFYAAWIAGGELSPGARQFTRAMLGGGIAAAALSVGLQGVDALGHGNTSIRHTQAWAVGLGTAYGATAVLAALAMAVAAASLGLRRNRWLAALALAGAGAALAASGHASAAAPQWLMRPAVFVHGVSVAFWTGALWPLASALQARRLGELRTFSRAIPIPLAALALSGVTLAVVQLRAADALWTTGYGLLLSAKLAAVALVLGLAAFNRAMTAAALSGDTGAARRIAVTARAEVCMVLIVLGLVAAWRFTPPPRALIDAAHAPIHLHLHGGKAMADVRIERNRDGSRRMTVVALDGQYGPLSGKEVTVTLAKPDAGIEPLRLRARHVEATIWSLEDVRIPQPGRWTLRIDILIDDFEKASVEDTVEFSR